MLYIEKRMDNIQESLQRIIHQIEEFVWFINIPSRRGIMSIFVAMDA